MKEKNLGYHTAQLVIFWKPSLFAFVVFGYFSFFLFAVPSHILSSHWPQLLTRVKTEVRQIIQYEQAGYWGVCRPQKTPSLANGQIDDITIVEGRIPRTGEGMSNFLDTLSIGSGNGGVREG